MEKGSLTFSILLLAVSRKMTGRFDDLPKGCDLTKIASAVRSVFTIMHEDGMTYGQIAKKVSIIRPTTEISVKVFINSKEAGRINRNNQALVALYDYIRIELHRLPDRARAEAMKHWGTLAPMEGDEHNDLEIKREMERSLGYLFYNWLHVNPHEIRRVAEKICGRYVMFRKSVKDPDVIVKSSLEIRCNSASVQVMEAIHSHRDRQGALRVSKGVIVPVVRNIYFILEIEKGEGLEMLAFKEPIQDSFSRMMGFVLSINMDRKILSARTFIEHASPEWESLPPRIRVKDAREHRLLSSRLLLLNESTCQTLPDQPLEGEDLFSET